jgi:hypothetical protein
MRRCENNIKVVLKELYGTEHIPVASPYKHGKGLRFHKR